MQWLLVFFYIYVMATSFFFIYAIASSFFYIYLMATSLFYIHVMATSLFYIHVMATSFCYIFIYIYIYIYITFTNWRSAQSFFRTQFFLKFLHCQPLHNFNPEWPASWSCLACEIWVGDKAWKQGRIASCLVLCYWVI